MARSERPPFEALESFQRGAGFAADGVLTESQQHTLDIRVAEQANRLDFRPFYDERARFTLGLPLAYLDAPTAEEGGSQWKSKDGRLVIVSQRSVKTGGTMAATYLDMLSGKIVKGVKYSTFRPGFFIVLGLDGQMRFYIRVHEDGDTAVAFFALWRDGDDDDIRRLVVAISNSIQVTQTDQAIAANTPGGVAPIDRVEQRPLPPLPHNQSLPALPDKPIVTGTGFFVSSAGYLITNAHVVENCQDAAIRLADGRWSRTSIVARNETSDLAILKSEIGAPAAATFRGAPPLKLGTEIVLFGYPRLDLLTSTGNVVNGLVSALAGPSDYAGVIQISAPVQSGNSGGAVLDKSGNVVGIVVAKFYGEQPERGGATGSKFCNQCGRCSFISDGRKNPVCLCTFRSRRADY
jgi:hypothetical protein